jgi:crotonobetainyl-CoA:carnitine CoA-transferase CaiB-like acyl-CoA transferase
MESTKATGPLSGIRVLDIGTMVAGPVAATFLGDFGAEVIKVEQPRIGDSLRHIGPFFEGESLWFNVESRNKRSITLDLRTTEGQRIFRLLAEKADVIVENFRPGTLAEWGLDYSSLKSGNERLIVLSTSGFGQFGPYAKRAGYDRMALAFGGLLYSTGYPDRPPIRPGNSLADYQTAMVGAFAIMLALYHRDVGGAAGQQIDLALYETVFRFMDALVPAYEKLGIKRERRGNLAFAAAPGEHFLTSDGRYMVVTVSSDSVFRKLCKAIGRPELALDTKFSSHDARCRNLDEINKIVADWILEQTVEHVCATFGREGVAFSLVFSIEDIMTDPHYLARENIISVEHPKLGTVKMAAPIPRMMGSPSVSPRAAEELGASNMEIFCGLLGLSEKEIADLIKNNII